MRLLEPFSGLKMIGGHTLFHTVLLLVSLLNLGFPAKTKANEEYLYTLNMLRVAHAIDICFAILKFLGSTPKSYPKHCFTFKLLDTLKSFFYLGAIIFGIYHETHTNTQDALNSKDYWINHAELFILIEQLVFFGQILCSTFVLLGYQIRGELGHNNDPNFQRFTVDTLTYYTPEIQWFSFMFVCFFLHLTILTKHYYIPSLNNNTLKLWYGGYMVTFNLLRMVLLMPYRNADLTNRKIDNKKWGILFGLEVAGQIMVPFFNVKTTSNTFGSCIIDCFIMVGMFILYKTNEPEENVDQLPDNKQPLLKCVETFKDEALKQSSRSHKKAKQLNVDNSIYNMALVTLIDPEIVDQWTERFKD